MLSPRWKKVVHDLRMNRSRTFFVIASVAVGIYAVSVILGGRGILLREFDQSYKASDPAAVTFYTMGFTNQQLDTVSKVQGADGLEPRTVVALRYTLDRNPSPKSTGWESLSVQALDDFDNQQANRITKLEADSWPPAQGEIILENATHALVDVKIGDVVTVETSDGTRAELKVAGFAHDINAMPAQYVNAITGYIAPSTLELLKTPAVYTQLMVRSDKADPTRADYEKVAERVRTALEENGVTVLFTQVHKPGAHFLGDVFKAVALLLLALGVLALFLSGFLVVNTISALMSQHTKQIGIMKAVGGKERQIGGMYLVMVFALGLAALAIGIPLGAWSGQGLVRYAATALNFQIGSMIPPVLPLAIAVAVGLLVPVLAALFPIVKGAKTPIIESFNPGMGAQFGHGLLDRILGRIRGLPRPVALSLRNTFVRKGRLVMTLSTLVLACAVVMAVVSVRVSITDTVDAYATHWTYDVRANLSTTQKASDVRAVLDGIPEIKDVETWSAAGVTLKRTDGSTNESVQIFALPAKTSYFHPDLLGGTWLSSGDSEGVVVNSDVLKDDPGIHVGSKITLSVRGSDRVFTVRGTSTSSFDGQAVYVTQDVWDEWTGASDTVDTVYIATDVHSNKVVDAVASEVEEKLDAAGHRVSEVTALHEVTETFGRQMGILLQFLYIMAGVLGAVGVIGLSGAMMINVIESTREIGVMRAIGASHGSIYSIYIVEGVVVALIAWLLGAALSWPISSLLTKALSDAMGIPLYYRYSVFGVFLTLGLVVAIAVLASIIPAWQASRVSVRDAISYE